MHLRYHVPKHLLKQLEMDSSSIVNFKPRMVIGVVNMVVQCKMIWQQQHVWMIDTCIV